MRNAAKRKALKAELDELRKRVDYWRSVLAVPAQRAKAEQEKVAGSEIQPVGTGDFGPIYDQFKGKPKEAVKFLMSKKEGEAIGALRHKDIGDIDLVWGK